MTLSVLLVEDNTDKLAAISAALTGREVALDIEHAADLTTARSLLRNRSYDLLVLDVAIPLRAGQLPVQDGGLRLLDELERSAHLRMPQHIVGLTAYSEVLETALPRFSSRAVSLIYYDPAGVDWAEALSARVWFIERAKACQSSNPQPRYHTDLAIVCALESPELRAVVKNGWSWEIHQEPGDPTIYYKADIAINGTHRKAVAAAACQMGMAATAVLATKMICAFRPEFVAMAGITAGREGVVSLGDILVANPTWDWGSGKIVETPDGPKHLPAPSQLNLSAHLREKFQVMAADTKLLHEIRDGWHTPPATVLKLVIGPVPSGASVIEDSGTIDQIAGQHRKFVGVEMEGYAVHVAVEEAPEPQPSAFVVKSVADFGIPGKGDDLHAYAAYTSAQAIRRFAESYLWR